MKYTSIERVYAKLQRDLPSAHIYEVDAIEWTGEALEFINAVRQYTEAVAFLKVKNFQTELPMNLHRIIQIAKNTLVEDPDSEAEPSDEDEVLNPLEESTDYPVCLDCNGKPYNDYDVAYYRPYYDLQYDYNLWSGNATARRCYVPVRLTTHSFFNSLVCSEDGTDCGYKDAEWSNGIYNKATPEYNIIDNSILRFNFEKGIVAVSYLRNKLDERGLPMIPDDISYITAITAYITYKQMNREFYAGKEGSQTRVQKAELDWHWYAKQASNKALIPQGIDEMQNLVDQRTYLIPRRNVYHNYFGNLNNREVKNILHTEVRNNIYYGRGRYTTGPTKVV